MDREQEIYVHMVSFTDASKQARWLSRLIYCETGVRREGKLWAVLAPTGTSNELTGTLESGQDDDYSAGEERSTQIADFSSDQDDWSRSDSDGWFYED